MAGRILSKIDAPLAGPRGRGLSKGMLDWKYFDPIAKAIDLVRVLGWMT